MHVVDGYSSQCLNRLMVVSAMVLKGHGREGVLDVYKIP